MANIFVSLFILVIGVCISFSMVDLLHGDAGEAIGTAILLISVLLAFLNYKKDFFKLKK